MAWMRNDAGSERKSRRPWGAWRNMIAGSNSLVATHAGMKEAVDIA